VRGPRPVGLLVVFAVLGFLLVTTASSASEAKRAAQPRKERLVDLIQDRRGEVGDLDAAVRQLRSRVATVQARESRRTAADEAATRRLAELSAQAGTTALRGRGVEVRMADSTRRVSSGEDVSAYRVHDRDLQLVVNALFAAGAEAVAINDVRLVATSPIREAGETIVVSFRPLSPPYTIEAIGADAAEFRAGRMAKQFARWHEVFGLGWRVREVSDLRVPAYAGRVAVSSARPGGGR
jgi:uncharacterized protein YlxW (UPF0749 family)